MRHLPSNFTGNASSPARLTTPEVADRRPRCVKTCCREDEEIIKPSKLVTLCYMLLFWLKLEIFLGWSNLRGPSLDVRI